MLTRVVDLAPSPARHQAWEYLTIAGDAGALEAPHLPVPADVTTETAKRFGIDAGETWIGLFPGAARGPSKRWPADSFAEAGRVLGQRTGHRIAVFGTRSDCAVCDRVAGGIAGACNLAGATSLRDLAALLQICRVVLCNDSGGMHLAAAVGTSVVAVFGATDPAKTGPLGRRHRVLAAERVVRSREIPRRSARAQRALEAIGPSRVVNAALEILTEPAGGRVEGAA